MTRSKARGFKISLVLLFVIANCAFLFAGDSKPPYVLLLDVSGSMESEGGVRYARYSSGQVSGIVQRIGQIIASVDGDAPIYVQPFSSSRDSFPLRGPLTAARVQSAVPNTASGKETELDAGLRLGMQNRPNSYLFILTDNKNDFSGSRSDRQFYELLAKSPAIHTVYFVPLAQAGAKDALVLYAIACGSAHRSTLRAVVSEFAKSVQSDSVQFRGFYDDKEQESLGFGQHVMQLGDAGEESPVTTEGDAIILSYNEGEPIEGSLRFRIHSNLKHWRIRDGELRKVEARVQAPSEYAYSDDVKLPINVSGGRRINVAPSGDSAEVYTLPLAAISDAGFSLSRSNLFRTHLPDITANIHLAAVVHVSENPADSDIRPEFNDALKQRIEAVRNLPEIMNLMTFQPDSSSSAAMERVIPINREVHIRVIPNPLKNLLAHFIEFGIPMLIIAAIVVFALLGRGKVYAIVEPGERTRLVKFSPMSRGVGLIWNGRKVATMQRSGNGFLIRPEAGYAAEPVAVSGNPARFEIRNLKSGDRGAYQVRSGATPMHASARKGRP